jgi:hypothetical protein
VETTTIPSSLKERKERPFALGVWWRRIVSTPSVPSGQHE